MAISLKMLCYFDLLRLSYALCAGVCLLPCFHQLDCSAANSSAGHGEDFKLDFFYKNAQFESYDVFFTLG